MDFGIFVSIVKLSNVLSLNFSFIRIRIELMITYDTSQYLKTCCSADPGPFVPLPDRDPYLYLTMFKECEEHCLDQGSRVD